MNKLLVIPLVALFGLWIVASASAMPLNNQSSPITISYKVINDEDSGMVGYWALDNYTKTVTVTPTNISGQFNITALYDGTFCTFNGSLSPQNGMLESADGCGTMIGGYSGYLTNVSEFNDSFNATNPVDLNGTQSDILKQVYANQTGNPASFNWVDSYFPGADGTHYADYSWGWTYELNGWNWSSGSNQTWVNSGAGNSGDIVTLVPSINSTDNTTSLTLPSNVTLSVGNDTVVIPANTTITGNSPDWNGTLNSPVILSAANVTPSLNGYTTNVSKVIEIGFPGTELTLSNPVELVFQGDAGKLVGYTYDGSTFTQITSKCNNLTSPTNVSPDCYIDNGSDLVVWTTHFTQFVTYTQTANPVPVQSSGGGAPINQGPVPSWWGYPYNNKPAPQNISANTTVENQAQNNQNSGGGAQTPQTSAKKTDYSVLIIGLIFVLFVVAIVVIERKTHKGVKTEQKEN